MPLTLAESITGKCEDQASEAGYTDRTRGSETTDRGSGRSQSAKVIRRDRFVPKETKNTMNVPVRLRYGFATCGLQRPQIAGHGHTWKPQTRPGEVHGGTEP